MGDTGDDYRALDAHKKVKKLNNIADSTNLLIIEGINFESKNNGTHLIVTDLKGNIIDFWPSTGKWIIRGGKTSRGVLNLIRHIKRRYD